MTPEDETSVLPYSAVQGQEEVKLALELAFVAPRLGGVLLSGERGTGKSTAVRAFCRMVYGSLPVTLPINATEDRVVGGWKIDLLMQGKAEEEPGLLHAADKQGMLYVDEINLLDDHIVNILLDVTATGILEVQREGQSHRDRLDFTLVGTMNPEEGGLRPQLLDRFGLMVQVRTEDRHRFAILRCVLDFEADLRRHQAGRPAARLAGWQDQDQRRCQNLVQARRQLLGQADSPPPEVADPILERAVALASELEVDGHRGERVLVLAAQALAAIGEAGEVGVEHLRAVTPLALQHRQRGAAEHSTELWGDRQTQTAQRILG